MDFFLSCFRDRDAEHSRGDMRRLWLSYPWQIFVQNKWQCLARKLSAVRHLSAVTVRNLLQQERSPLLQIGLRQVSTFQFSVQNSECYQLVLQLAYTIHRIFFVLFPPLFIDFISDLLPFISSTHQW